MFTCKVQNEKGEILALTNKEDKYQVISVEGMNPPSALINLSKIAMIDGSKFNSSQLNTRNIVIHIRINGDVEANRIALYSFFRSKEWCRFYYANETRSVYIEGYVESIEVTPFTQNEVMQVSIICPNPYLRDVNEQVKVQQKVFDNFEFPFAIDSVGIPFSIVNRADALVISNTSERETGLKIEITFNDECDKIVVRKLSTNETFTINYSFIAYDKVVIDTNKGSKSVRLIRDAVSTNIFPSISRTSKFFQLDLGDNIFDYVVDDGDHDDRAEVYFKYNFLYGGV